MKLNAGNPIKGMKIDVAFIGSCTNGRLSDFREVAKSSRAARSQPACKAIVVPGSQIVASIAEQEGLDKIFRDAGFEWRGAGCSMCLAMNPDKLIGDQLCASLVQPQLQRPPGQPHRPHHPDVARHGRRRRGHRRGHGRPRGVYAKLTFLLWL